MSSILLAIAFFLLSAAWVMHLFLEDSRTKSNALMVCSVGSLLFILASIVTRAFWH